MRFDGKVVVITGGGSGIGAATARCLVAEGAQVVVSGRNADRLNAIVDELGDAATALPGDVTRDEHADALVAAAINRYGGLDAVVANAGVGSSGSIEHLTNAEWDRTLDVNLHGPLRLARSAFPALRARGGGAVVLIASVNGIVNTASSAAYDISKAAVISMARSLAIDGGRWNIRANALCPGWVETPMADDDMDLVAAERSITREDAYRVAVRHTPLGRVASPREIATCCAFLISDDASFVTGTTLVADGGGLAVDVTGLGFGPPSSSD